MKTDITVAGDYEEVYHESIAKPEDFWSAVASGFTWKKKWDSVLKWDFAKPEVKWFLGGKLNITENCLDRHLATRGDQTAIIWEPNHPDDKPQHITYRQLHTEVCRVANMLKSQGISKGDRVCIYLPMIPEAAYSILACARIGAVHSVVFAGFSSGSLVDRINDSGCKAVITADGGTRGEKNIALKPIVDDAITKCPSVEKVIVVKKTGVDTAMRAGRDVWWNDLIKAAADFCPAEEMDSEDLLFIL